MKRVLAVTLAAVFVLSALSSGAALAAPKGNLQLGFGANWGRPNDALFGTDLDDQYALEAYYRLQVSRELSITPSVQLLIDPALNPDEDILWVYGLRARLAF